MKSSIKLLGALLVLVLVGLFVYKRNAKHDNVAQPEVTQEITLNQDEEA